MQRTANSTVTYSLETDTGQSLDRSFNCFVNCASSRVYTSSEIIACALRTRLYAYTPPLTLNYYYFSRNLFEIELLNYRNNRVKTILSNHIASNTRVTDRSQRVTKQNVGNSNAMLPLEQQTHTHSLVFIRIHALDEHSALMKRCWLSTLCALRSTLRLGVFVRVRALTMSTFEYLCWLCISFTTRMHVPARKDVCMRVHRCVRETVASTLVK